MQDLSKQEWKALLNKDDNAVIIDVRTDEEIADGFIPGAQQIDIQNPPLFMEALQQLDPEKNYYVYCKAGGRSVQACMIMNSVGISQTYNLIGGFSEWDGDVENP